jgi:hypothetical protein
MRGLHEGCSSTLIPQNDVSERVELLAAPANPAFDVSHSKGVRSGIMARSNSARKASICIRVRLE